MKRRTASAAKTLRYLRLSADHRASGGRRRYVDAAAALLLLALTVVSQWDLLRGGTVVGLDSATQYYPWYSYLGESLRSGDVPGWNPRLFSGVPFAGDPLSGWTYLPAMLLFTFLPLAAAAKAYMFLHPLLAGLFTYALARTLRMNPSGALLAAVAYEFAGYLYVQNTCCFPYVNVLAWFPLAVLGAELAIRSSRWLDRGLWWGVSGLGLSQILASWLGQGAYYALLALGGYVAYRTLVSPPDAVRGVRGRVSGLFVHGGAVLLFGFGLAAAGVLPRLEYNALSGLAGGYTEAAGGNSVEGLYRLFAFPGVNYAGAAVLTLALAAPLIVRGRFAAPYLAALCLCALTLAGRSFTPLHSLLYLLPNFERLHPHFPQRVMVIFYLGAALLAGAALTGLGERPGGRRRKASLLALPALAAVFLATRGIPGGAPEADGGASGPWEATTTPFLVDNGVRILAGPLVVMVVVLALAAAYALLPARLAAWRGLASTLLVLAVFVDLNAAGAAVIESRLDQSGKDKRLEVDLGEYYAPTGATRFLQSRDEPSRYFGYAPRSNRRGGPIPYYLRHADPETRALEAENRAILHDGLQSAQGYNAVHLARYDEYLAALNGRPQHYRDADVFKAGLDSPLLDLLNVRHVVVPADVAPTREGLKRLARKPPIAYEDDAVKILENPEALPRAWIVHSARRVGPERALDLLASGAVDPRETALLEEPPPKLAKPDGSSRDRASVTGYEANRIELETSAGARGLLVLSEVYYPAWRAYVDGERVPLYRADQLLRAVPVPAGEHTVELRYESRTLRGGMAISLLSALTLAALVVVRVRRRRDTR